MRRVVFLRSQLPETDSRLQRYLSLATLLNMTTHVLGWKRLGGEWKEEGSSVTLYSRVAKIGGGRANAVNLMFWNWFLLKWLVRHRREYELIYSVDFDTIIPAYIAAKLLGKRIVFDIYDKYTDSRGVSGVFGRIIDFVEKYIAKKVDHLVLPHECRLEQLGIEGGGRVKILKNVPVVPGEDFFFENKVEGRIKISYVGILEEKHRGLEDLIEAVMLDDGFELVLAGNGPLRSYVLDKAAQCGRVVFCGEVPPLRALKIMAESNVISGMYYRSNRNHLFASPNKYYEHLLLGRPLLTTSGTPPGNDVEVMGTGFVINEGLDEIKKVLNEIQCDHQLMLNASSKARELWCAKYRDYFKSEFVVIFESLLR